MGISTGTPCCKTLSTDDYCEAVEPVIEDYEYTSVGAPAIPVAWHVDFDAANPTFSASGVASTTQQTGRIKDGWRCGVSRTGAGYGGGAWSGVITAGSIIGTQVGVFVARKFSTVISAFPDTFVIGAGTVTAAGDQDTRVSITFGTDVSLGHVITPGNSVNTTVTLTKSTVNSESSVDYDVSSGGTVTLLRGHCEALVQVLNSPISIGDMSTSTFGNFVFEYDSGTEVLLSSGFSGWTIVNPDWTLVSDTISWASTAPQTWLRSANKRFTFDVGKTYYYRLPGSINVGTGLADVAMQIGSRTKLHSANHPFRVDASGTFPVKLYQKGTSASGSITGFELYEVS